ncbi:chemotaxis protein CheW [Bacillaceae bacterium S4-13-58]
MEETTKIIVFELNTEKYGVNIEQVLSIERLQNLTQIPKSADYVKGILNLRGEIIPIIDLKNRLEIGYTEITDLTRVLIVSINSSKIGIMVDSATDVLDIDSSTINFPPAMVAGVGKDYISGVVTLQDKLLILLNLENVINAKEIKSSVKN